MCSRCARLQIQCEGGGEQRYKFKEAKQQTVALRFTKSKSDSSSSSSASSRLTLSRTPSNETIKVAGAFISQLEVTDIRYEMSCYGPFLKDIPKRLGINEALDASVSAVTSVFATFYTRQHTVDTFATYGEGLKALRKCLNDPIKAQAPETLCATYLLQICQVGVSSHFLKGF